MSQSTLTIVGYAVGTYVGAMYGYPQLGGMIGGAIGGYAGASLADPIRGPRLGDLATQFSTYGAPISRIYGGDRVAGTVIWAQPLHESEDDVGKGGQEVTAFSYFGTFAIAIGEGPITAIRKIWTDAKLSYDISEDADIETKAASAAFGEFFVFYTGSEDQLPDPTIEAYEGVGNVEPYRGTAYIVFANLPLAQYGNRIPQIRVETTTEEPYLLEAEDVQPLTLQPWATNPRGQGDAEFNYPPTDGGTSYSSYSAAYEAMLAASGGIADQYIGYYTSAAQVMDRFESFNSAEKTLSTGNGVRYVYLCFNVEQPDVVAYDGIGGDSPRYCGSLVGQGATPSGDLSYMMSSYYDDFNPEHSGNLGLLRLGPTPNGDTRPGYALGNHCIGSLFGASASVSPHWIIRIERLLTTPVQTCDPGDPAVVGSAQLPDNADVCITADGTLSPNFQYTLTVGTFKQLQELEVTGGSTGTVDAVPLGPALLPGDQNYSNQAFWEAEAAAAGVTGTYGVDFPRAVTEAAVGGVQYQAVAEGSIILGEIVTDICETAGLELAQFDVDELNDVVLGFSRGRVMPARSAIEPLRMAYFFDAVESGDQILFVKRGAAPGATIDVDMLGAGQDDGQERLVTDRMQEAEIPLAVSIGYPSRAADYQVGVQQAKRTAVTTTQISNRELPVVMTDVKAAQVAETALYEAWTSRNHRRITLPLPYTALLPTDIVLLPDGEDMRTVRIVEKSEDAGVLTLECVDYDQADYTVRSLTAGDVGGASTITFNAPARLELIDVPLLRDADDGPGYYVAVAGYGSRFRGASVVRSGDGGATYSPVLDANREATMGTAMALGDFAGGNNVDEGNTLDVVVFNRGSLSSITRSQLLDNGNAGLVGSEVIQYQRAVLLSGTTYRLSGLLRGRVGTEQHIGTHAAGERFIALNQANIYRAAGEVGHIDQASKQAAVAFGTTIAAAFKKDFTNTAVGLKPLSPVHLGAVLMVNGSMQIDWVRRGRLTGAWADGVDVPLSEASEAYEIDISRNGALIRTLTSSTEEVTYTAAQQATDFGLDAVDVDVEVFQMSAVVGRGFGAATEATTFDAATSQDTRTITFSGVFSSGVPVYVYLSGQLWVSYTTTPGDATLSGVATSVAAALNALSALNASAVGAVVTVTGNPGDTVVLAVTIGGATSIGFNSVQTAAAAGPGTGYQAGVYVVNAVTGVSEPVPSGITFSMYFERPAFSPIGSISYTTTYSQSKASVIAGLAAALAADPVLSGMGYVLGGTSSPLAGAYGILSGAVGLDGTNVNAYATSPFDLTISVQSPGSAAVPVARPQITDVYFLGVPVPGEQYVVTLGGVEFTYTVGAGSPSETISDVAAEMAALIDVSATLSAAQVATETRVTGQDAVPFAYAGRMVRALVATVS